MTRRLASAMIALLCLGVPLVYGATPATDARRQLGSPAQPTSARQVGDRHPDWEWPVTDQRVILRPFTAPAHRYGAGHRGIDIAASVQVIAPADGVVHFAGTVVDRAVLSITHPSGYLSSFEPVTTSLRRGDAVHRGDVIGQLETVPLDAGHFDTGPLDGESGRTHCRSPCLHFGVRLNGEYVSPLLLVGAVSHSVLLPTRYARGWAMR
jgi:murein DD-endopeptidase MepM/ murein hydrolase activator NlpD